MDVQELISNCSPFIKKNWLPLSLGILGMIFFVYGLMGLFSANKTSSDDIIFEASSINKNSEIKTMLIDVEGAVVKPGVYKLPQESRIQDGLVAAGGLSAKADREYIAKNLNLATKLIDGAKVYIPVLGEIAVSQSMSNTSSEGVTVGSSRFGEAGNLTNLNTSSESELDSLPGVGPVTAQKIISGRPYNSVNELLDKKIVSSKVFGQIKEKVTVY
jgi:competence protein ComEA